MSENQGYVRFLIERQRPPGKAKPGGRKRNTNKLFKPQRKDSKLSETKTAEVATVDDAQIQAAIDAITYGKPLPYAADAEAVSRGILERILAAESYDEIFRPQKLEAWRDHKGRPAEVTGFHLNRTTFDFDENNGSAVYAVIDLTWLDDGETATVTCGGRNVLTQLVQALRKGLIPGCRVKLEGNRTGEGYEALWLTAV